MFSYKHADAELSYFVYNASTEAIVEDTISVTSSFSGFANFTVNADGAGNQSPGQALYTFKAYCNYDSTY